ncbi:MAG: tRNA (guanosine(46)-N7)-methyltransferase TrmB [Planctomycetota bacterium]
MGTAEKNEPPAPGATRLHVGGKLSFRRRVRQVADRDLPCIDLTEHPPPLERLVPEQFDTVEIEVGSGKGTFLLAAATAQPDVFFLGIEAAPGYARYAAERLQRASATNGLLLVDNAKLYLEDRVADGSVARLHVYFSDPWPKRRHRKRRFFTPEMGDVITRVLRPGGYLLCATDNAAYAGQICRLLGESEGLVRDAAEERRLHEAPPGHGFVPTSFDTKYQEQGRIIRRYAYRRP